MLSLSAQPTLANTAFTTKGGFLWWYVDIIDEQGNGLVLIWSFGLPFLPNYASKAKKQNAPEAKERPSVVISIYKNFQLDCYLFQEYAPHEVSWNEDHWKFANNSFDRNGKILQISLHMPVPKTNLHITGEIAIHGTQRRYGNVENQAAHQWVPLLMPAHAQVEIRSGSSEYIFSGRAYHDHNSGLRPLHDLNIQYWWWGRIALPEKEFIWYSLIPSDNSSPIHIYIFVYTDGRVEIQEGGNCTCMHLHKSIFGLSAPRQFLLEIPNMESISIDVHSTVDDGPFYQRYIISTDSYIGKGWGIAEQVVPNKIDEYWLRPLVQMRVSKASHSRTHNSFWIPLFTGPKTGRWKRLFQQLYTRGIHP